MPSTWKPRKDGARVGCASAEYLWARVGGFSFVDSNFLGRAHQLGVRRVHLVAHGAGAGGLEQVRRFSTIWRTAEAQPLVLRTVNPGGVVGSLQHEAARQRHQEDCRRMVEKDGEIPW